MVDETENIPTSKDEAILQQQFRRALTSFEGIVLSQIDIKNTLADRLNYSIRAGLIILSVIAISILILLFTLSTQVQRISNVVNDINGHFGVVSEQMERIDVQFQSIEQRVALLDSMQEQTAVMDGEMGAITGDLHVIRGAMGGISHNVAVVRNNVMSISAAIDRMGLEVLNMSHDMGRISKPSRGMNKMFPFQ
jgi:methyl-accepting chemotaxis protein